MHEVIDVTDLKFKQYWSELFANDPLQNPFYSQLLSATDSHASVEPTTHCENAGVNASGLASKIPGDTVIGNANATRENSAAPCASKSSVVSDSSDASFIDHSFVVIAENEPVFACSLTLHTDKCGHRCLGYFGIEASSHVNRQSMESGSNNFQLEAVQLLQEHINRLIDEIRPDKLEYLDPVSCGVMSPVTQVLLEKGARPIVQTAKIFDLTLSEHALKRKIRKSQLGLINWGQRNLDINIVSGDEFGAIDADALKRICDTARAADESPYTSRARYEQLIRQSKAFLVRGDYAGVHAACALIVHTARTCHFVFGSSVAHAPDRPMMPALLWAALQHGKALGCTLFEMGRLAQADNTNSERARLLNSFGGDSQTRLKVCLAV